MEIFEFSFSVLRCSRSSSDTEMAPERGAKEIRTVLLVEKLANITVNISWFISFEPTQEIYSVVVYQGCEGRDSGMKQGE